MDNFSSGPEASKILDEIALNDSQKMTEILTSYRGDEENSLTLFLVGIKDLKQINDRLGRQGGDKLILAVGQKLAAFVQSSLSNCEYLAKMPGREFLLVLRGQPPQTNLENIARNMLKILSADFGETDDAVHISARIGIALSHIGEGGDELLHRAGLALGRAYARKGKKFAVQAYQKSPASKKNIAVDAGLRSAIAEQKISIVLQPQFEVDSGRLIGVEALARLDHGELGEIGAGELFASADRCDLREELSHIIQAEAINIAANWPAALDNLRLSVNLGAEELGEGYSEKLDRLLADSGFDAERLTLELTEESLVRDIETATAQLTKLREKHIRIAVDDFGTGYSSLAYLKDLPLDYLKIDKGMTPDIGGSGKDRIVLRAIIAMGQALGLQIIAEGVEREEELEMLAAEGCDYFQGFLRSQPLSPDDFEHFALLSN